MSLSDRLYVDYIKVYYDIVKYLPEIFIMFFLVCICLICTMFYFPFER